MAVAPLRTKTASARGTITSSRVRSENSRAWSRRSAVSRGSCPCSCDSPMRWPSSSTVAPWWSSSTGSMPTLRSSLLAAPSKSRTTGPTTFRYASVELARAFARRSSGRPGPGLGQFAQHHLEHGREHEGQHHRDAGDGALVRDAGPGEDGLEQGGHGRLGEEADDQTGHGHPELGARQHEGQPLQHLQGAGGALGRPLPLPARARGGRRRRTRTPGRRNSRCRRSGRGRPAGRVRTIEHHPTVCRAQERSGWFGPCPGGPSVWRTRAAFRSRRVPGKRFCSQTSSQPPTFFYTAVGTTRKLAWRSNRGVAAELQRRNGRATAAAAAWPRAGSGPSSRPSSPTTSRRRACRPRHPRRPAPRT